VYIANFSISSNSVLKVPASDLTCSTPGDCTKLGAGASPALLHPTGVAVDSSGNVYITNNGNNIVLKVHCAEGSGQ
jgi:DNA-binding beta-propeller fold protein YncE